jgi:hypothetical protein
MHRDPFFKCSQLAVRPRDLSLGRALSVCALAIVAGCKQAPGEAPSAVASEVTLNAAAPNPVSPSVEEAAYSVSLATQGELKVGQAARAELVLRPKPPFHTNGEYPYKFKLDPNADLGLATETVTKEGANVTAELAVFPVVFTPKAAGNHTLSGLFAFSVCKDDQCLVERKQLALAVQVVAP